MGGSKFRLGPILFFVTVCNLALRGLVIPRNEESQPTQACCRIGRRFLVPRNDIAACIHTKSTITKTALRLFSKNILSFAKKYTVFRQKICRLSRSTWLCLFLGIQCLGSRIKYFFRFSFGTYEKNT